jgi:hypothetical protein
VPINIGKADYREENEEEWVGAGNVAVATTGERLLLREPLAVGASGPTTGPPFSIF